ncbi:hypothetical protein ACHAXA_008562 [Cyclostephanos tholiformis]|uniref:phosphoglycerate mutase (2,3-diphosphoglycerate-dependent) n=1 Tax=Cyclostephanos tholiformis TaxID=382380 RepID=A0ABD3RGS0_9STRA
MTTTTTTKMATSSSLHLHRRISPRMPRSQSLLVLPLALAAVLVVDLPMMPSNVKYYDSIIGRHHVDAFPPFATTITTRSSTTANRRHGTTMTINMGDGDGEMNTIDQYSNDLYSGRRANGRRNERRERRLIKDESSRYAIIDDDAMTRRGQRRMNGLLDSIASMASSTSTRLVGVIGAGGGDGLTKKKPGSLILLRCGESEWSKTGRFTGWADPDLIPEGITEIEHAGRLLLSEGYEPDIIYTSRLKRAVKSTWTILNALDSPYLPVYKSWRLNERSYGALTGLGKMDAARELGVGVVQAWRVLPSLLVSRRTRFDAYR